MRILHRSSGVLIVSVLSGMLLGLLSCTTEVKIRKFDPPKSLDAKFTAERDGLRVSVDPYKEQNRLLDYFGYDLLSKGVLPIFVLLENLNAEDGYILVKERTGLVMMKSPNYDQVSKIMGDNAVQKSPPTHAQWLAWEPFLVTTIPVVGLPLAWEQGRRAKNDQLIRRNLEDKVILDKTIYPGSSHSGFLFFVLNTNKGAEGIRGIALCLKNIRSKEALFFMIEITSERVGE